MGALGFVSEIWISTRFSSQTVGNCRMLWHWGFDTSVEKNKKRRGKEKRNKRNLKYSYDQVAWCWARFTPRSRSLGPSPGQTRSLFWVHGRDNLLAQECKWLGKGCSWQICNTLTSSPSWVSIVLQGRVSQARQQFLISFVALQTVLLLIFSFPSVPSHDKVKPLKT